MWLEYTSDPWKSRAPISHQARPIEPNFTSGLLLGLVTTGLDWHQGRSDVVRVNEGFDGSFFFWARRIPKGPCQSFQYHTLLDRVYIRREVYFVKLGWIEFIRISKLYKKIYLTLKIFLWHMYLIKLWNNFQ